MDARLSVLEKGHKPKIIRTTFDEFFLGSQKLLEKIATAEQAAEEDRRVRAEASPEGSTSLLNELAISHYASFGDIGAFVVDQEAWSKWDASSHGSVVWMDYARMSQADYASRWVVFADGRVEFAG